MLRFYEVDYDYVKRLKEIDDKIPNVNYENHNKFFCGVVLNVNGHDYFAPISSFKEKRITNFLIRDDKKIVSSIRFSFMFPCRKEYVTEKDFSKEDKKYSELLRKELMYCNLHIDEIFKLAKRVYKFGLKEETRIKFNICDFKKLEKICDEFDENR